jgi:hypothetical protein
LTDKTRYFWRAQAEDAHGFAGFWMDTASFFVKDTGPDEPPTEIIVKVSTILDRELSGLRVYAFKELGAYTGKKAVTDETGAALFDPADFADGSYKFRVDYLGYRFWSDSIMLPGTYRADVVISEETAVVTVNTDAGSLQGVKVYLFSAGGSYLGLNQKTDETGQVTFQLPTGVSFKFRADILGGKYWSEDTTLTSGGATTVDLNAGGGIFQVTLQEEPGVPLAGVKVYLFSPNGRYLGQNQVSDPIGRVAFDVSEGTYTVRADLLGYQFWSPETHVTIDTNVDFTVAHQDAIVTLDNGTPEVFEPLAGINVYLFKPSGAYLGEKRVTDENGQARFHLPRQPYKIRADFLGKQYWSDVFTWTDPTITIPMADVEITVTGGGFPVQDQTVYVFSPSGSYLGIRQITNGEGKVVLRLPQGEYKFRTDYQGSRYWSDVESMTTAQQNLLTMSTGGGRFAVSVLKATAQPLAGIKCYVFSADDAYLGMHGATDGNGQVFFDLADGNFKFRLDYLGTQFWSNVVSVPEVLSTDLAIAHEPVEVTVSTGAGLLEGGKVYLFSTNGTYLGRYKETDSAGTVSFDLPVGSNYQFRADILGNRYWSDMHEVSSGETNFVPINAGGGVLQMTVQKDEDLPMPELKVFLFNAAGTYLGRSETTDALGQVEFSVPVALYKLRVDYLGYQFWSEAVLVVEDTAMEMPIIHRPVEIAVRGSLQGLPAPVEGIKVYLFSPTDTYLGQSKLTDADGKAIFDLPQKSYKVRADYLGQQFWSESSVWQHTPVAIPMADAEVTVTGAGLPRRDVKIYLFSATGAYLGISDTTDGDGKVRWRLPAGTYMFRVDYQGNRYWSTEESLTADQITPVIVSVGGGSFAFTVLKSGNEPLEGSKCYVFSEQGAYLGMRGATNSDGQVFFDLADGTYSYRVDHLGYQFWSPVYDIPTNLSGYLDLESQSTVITVEGVYQTSQPLAGLKVYLFTPSSSYLGQHQLTDSDGQVAFSLPDQTYRVRVDYRGHQFWSEDFRSGDAVVTIQQGLAEIHVQRSGNDVAGAKVYLFDESGSYLGWNETTNASGRTELTLPDRTFKFRIDENGGQHWTPVIQILAGEESVVEVETEQ